MDGTENKSRKLKYYTDLGVQTGTNQIRMRFFLTDLGEHKVILGYSWFTTIQPKIDWKQGWINTSHFPIILYMDNSGQVKYLPRQTNVPQLVHKSQ
jgi:hypothetical protein